MDLTTSNKIKWESFTNKTPDVVFASKSEDDLPKSFHIVEILVSSNKLEDWYRAMYKITADNKSELIIYDSNYILLSRDKKIDSKDFTHWVYAPVV